jgi:hypothetical protein
LFVDAGVITVKKFIKRTVEGPQSQLFGTVVCAIVSSVALAVMMTDFRPAGKTSEKSLNAKKKSKTKKLKHKRQTEENKSDNDF